MKDPDARSVSRPKEVDVFFVPVIPHEHPPSLRTRELADLLGRVIQEYEQHHPAVTGSEVRAAARLAVQRSSRKGGLYQRLAAVGAGLAALLGAFTWVAVNRGSPGGDATPVAAIAVAVLAIAILAVVLRKMGD